jgi:uncharacterized protein
LPGHRIDRDAIARMIAAGRSALESERPVLRQSIILANMTTETVASRPPTRDLPGLVGLLFLLACLTLASTLSIHRLPASGTLSPSTKLTYYGTTIVVEWILAGYAAWRLQRMHVCLKSLIDIPSTAKSWLIDIGITVGFFLVWAAIGQGLTVLLKPGTPRHMILLPSNPMELAFWILMSLSAGFCEELAFRGYLQKALEFSTSAGIAIVTQGIIFGLVHFYQGIKLVTIIIVLGTMLGLLAHWRRKLWPGMMFHALQDILGAVIR